MASGFSILAIMGIFSSDSFSISSLRLVMSLASRTNDKAIQSSSFEIAYIKSFLSFFVSEGVEILVLGKLTPFLEDNFPPCIFLNFTTSFLLVEITSKINLPSSIRTLSPFFTSLAKSLYESDAFVLLPIISLVVDNVNSSPFLKITPSSIFPTLILGPCKSARMATLVSNS